MNKLDIAQSTIVGGGRGVFAGVDFKEGEVIEHCPVIEIDSDHVDHVGETMLINYIYYLGKTVIVLGYGSIYNHSYRANAKYIDRTTELFVDFVAIADIKKGEEILVNYNPDGNETDKLWFE